MKEFKICLYGKSFNIIKDEDGFFKMPEELKKYDGFNVNLKPSHEPMVLARKPLSEKTVAENVLKWGTGAINIDESRVGNDGGTKKINTENCRESLGKYGDGLNGGTVQSIDGLGRWPANLIHDGSDEVQSIFPETKSDSGNASRYFYCAKASKKDRNDGLDSFDYKVAGGIQGRQNGSIGSITYNQNHHPTVKPTDLMQYLVKLITPIGGTVLDPFNGSGSTGKACAILKDRNYKYVGIDLSQEYLDISKARIENEINKK